MELVTAVERILVANTFVGDNDESDTPLPPLSDLLWAEVTKLRQDKVRLEEDIVHFANELNEVTTQRDYARREVCRSRASCIKDKQPEEIANALGWDCFKENGK